MAGVLGGIDATEAYFSRASVKSDIGRLSEQLHVTIYLGAGATMDRTGTSWAELVAELLREDFRDSADRATLLDSSSPIEAATVAAQSYQNRFGEDWRDRLNDSIRSRLYRQPLSPSGKIVESAVDLAISCIERGGSAVIVTPNYDDFIIQECERRVDMPEYAYVPMGPTDSIDIRQLLHEVQSEVVSGTLWIVHVHGLLRSHVDEEGDVIANPVLSERDYWATAERSREVLSELFRDRSVVIAGSSMTDAPLLNALLDTSGDGPKWALLRTSEKSPGGKAFATSFAKVRLQHFGVHLVPVDHYSQIAQLLAEIRICGEVGSSKYLAHNSSDRYGARLTRWWRDWMSMPGSLSSRQNASHKYLTRKMPRLRSILDAAESEPLKLEIWARWQPERRRDLRLWASSIGPWVDGRTMRDVPIEGGEDYVAVQAFCRGSVVATQVKDSRWRSYLATPIWLDEDIGREFAAGVAVLSSIHSSPESAIGPHNSTRVSAALLDIHQIGRKLLDAQQH